MRTFILMAALLLSTLVQAAEPVNSQTYKRAFERAGLWTLCEQSGPLLMQGLNTEDEQLRRLFNADLMCAQLAGRVASSVDAQQVQQAISLLESPLAKRFVDAELAVGAEGEAGFKAYREQLASRPPLPARLELVRRLDAAAYSTELSALLRYEIGKTQAWMALKARGAKPDERALSEMTAAQLDLLRESSGQSIEAFMLYAYRQIPSEELQAYAELYEQPPLQNLLAASAEALPHVFASRRATLQ
jgi:hypothetical protein